MTQPYELKQMLPVVSDGETESVYAVFTVNQNLIKTGIFVDGVGVDSKYLTAGQIEMLKNLELWKSAEKSGKYKKFLYNGIRIVRMV